MGLDGLSDFRGVVAAFESRYGVVRRTDFFALVASCSSGVGTGSGSRYEGVRVLESGDGVVRVVAGGPVGESSSFGDEVGALEEGVGCWDAAVSDDEGSVGGTCGVVGDVGSPTGVLTSESGSFIQRGKHWKKNLAKRLKKKSASSFGEKKKDQKGGSFVSSGADDTRCVEPSFVNKKVELASSYDDRRIAENKLATQKAEYQLKKNEYLTRSRVAEQQWETERLTCDQKLQKITEARFGTKPGFAETLVSANISSSSLPSMSQGTLSPDSSISVAEVNRMFKLIADLTAQVAQLTVESKAMKETAVLSAYEQRKLEMENMTFEQIAALRGTEKDIRPDGSPVKYDAIGQEIYSECGRPDFMNQYDYRSSITVSEDGQ